MRTTIDLPDELYRTLKARAAMSGVTMRELIMLLLERGLAQAQIEQPQRTERRPPPPVIIPVTGEPISITPEDIHRLEEEEDLEKLARSSGR